MNAYVIDSVKNLITRRAPNLGHLHISWFGGEPLLACNAIYDILDHVKMVQSENGALKFSSGMTTNGYFLNRKNLISLTSKGVRFFQITLDGYQDDHDRYRRRFSGDYKTFDKIWSNLLNMKNTDLEFSVCIRIHHTPATLNAIETLIKNVNSSFSGDRRFSVFIRPISKLGGKDDNNISTYATYADGVAASEHLISMVEDLNIVRVEENYICYAAKPNSFVIRQDGSIGKCTVALYNDINVVGQINPDGSIRLNHKLSNWVDGILDDDIQFLNCPWSVLKKQGVNQETVTANSVDV
jgi:uncharacterized protein